MNLQELILLLLSVLSSALGQLFLKFGALKLGKVTGDNALGHIVSIATTSELLTGLLAYGFGAIAYILLLTRVQLSVAAPAASLIYLFSVLFGFLFFNESITFIRSAGLGLILCGVIMVTSR